MGTGRARVSDWKTSVLVCKGKLKELLFDLSGFEHAVTTIKF